MKNIVAYSLWGDNPMYWVGALKNIELANKFYPDFISRFYIDKKCRSDLIESIKGDKVEVILVDSKEKFHGMFWRFLASEEADVFLSRDCDSRISEREVAAVNDWLCSDKNFHIMRDHPHHAVPIMGGMWGCRNKILNYINVSKLIENWTSFEQKGIDQFFLGMLIYPYVKDKSMEHSEFNLRFGGETRSFPTKRENYEFVGDVFDEHDNRHQDYWKMIRDYELKC